MYVCRYMHMCIYPLLDIGLMLQMFANGQRLKKSCLMLPCFTLSIIR